MAINKNWRWALTQPTANLTIDNLRTYLAYSQVSGLMIPFVECLDIDETIGVISLGFVEGNAFEHKALKAGLHKFGLTYTSIPQAFDDLISLGLDMVVSVKGPEADQYLAVTLSDIQVIPDDSQDPDHVRKRLQFYCEGCSAGSMLYTYKSQGFVRANNLKASRRLYSVKLDNVVFDPMRTAYDSYNNVRRMGTSPT